MCIACDIVANRKAMTPDIALHAIATSHRNVLAQQLADAPATCTALFGQIPDDGCNLWMDVKRDTQDGTQTLTARVDNADKVLRITYAHVDLNASVAYTGNGPEGQSRIGVDAIEAAMEYIATKTEQLESLREMGVDFGRDAVRMEHDMMMLVKRCLRALHERAFKDSATE